MLHGIAENIAGVIGMASCYFVMIPIAAFISLVDNFTLRFFPTIDGSSCEVLIYVVLSNNVLIPSPST
jgi:hypothetical protein